MKVLLMFKLVKKEGYLMTKNQEATEIISELKKSPKERTLFSRNPYVQVISWLRLYEEELTLKSQIDLLKTFQLILKDSKTKGNTKGSNSYFMGNMNGNSEFEGKFKDIFSKDFSKKTMQLFLSEYIEHLKVAKQFSENRVGEFNLRNLEVFLDEYCDIKESQEVSDRVISLLENAKGL